MPEQFFGIFKFSPLFILSLLTNHALRICKICTLFKDMC